MGDQEFGDDIIIAPEEDTEDTVSDGSGISLPTEEEGEEGEDLEFDGDSEDEPEGEDGEGEDELDLSDFEEGSDDEEASETPADEKREEENGEDDGDEVVGTLDDLNIEDILKELDEGEDALDSADESLKRLEQSGADQGEIDSIKSDNERLRSALSKANDQLKKLMNEKGDLSYRVAELEAFGGDIQDPRVLIVSKNLEKAKSGDEKAKSRAVDTLKAMLDELTESSYDGEKIDKETDMISKIENYATNTNPKIKTDSSDDDSVITL